jgi:hypothetical protein
MATKFFTGLPLDAPDPECVHGEGAHALAALGGSIIPAATTDHSWTSVSLIRKRVTA